ncbi:unnamed protein product [Didymodactylos carnosus]|uniref:Uncharacterized protein n=2 Tax=Didymodactylos carnosus TaxID=1234261 RepID=A0A8S2GKT3_9BILA|nr:unnamed protein product [Didymodactylos carnosus]CAF3530409.1 unnamed protein product [Didymodactylos carnosus]
MDINSSDDDGRGDDGYGVKVRRRGDFVIEGSEVSGTSDDKKEDGDGNDNDSLTNISKVETWSGTSFKPDLPNRLYR